MSHQHRCCECRQRYDCDAKWCAELANHDCGFCKDCSIPPDTTNKYSR